MIYKIDKIYISHREARVCSFQNAIARDATFLSSVTNLRAIAGEYIFYISDHFPNICFIFLLNISFKTNEKFLRELKWLKTGALSQPLGDQSLEQVQDMQRHRCLDNRYSWDNDGDRS